MSKIKILFIINPISGGKRKTGLTELIGTYLDHGKFSPEYVFTDYPGHAAKLALEAHDFTVVAAVGGDGTINEVASALSRSDKILGIIPQGSGNGLARSLKIPMGSRSAVERINRYRHQQIDVAKLNDRYFFNMAGMGFDAHISAVFAGSKGRGLRGYIALGLKEMLSYKPQSYQLLIDGNAYQRDAFAVSVANSSQYGNNVHISPRSSLTDGLLDVCIVRPFPLYKLPILAYEMLAAKTHRSDLVEIIRGKRIEIVREKEDSIHLDGEPFVMGKKIDMEVLPLSLRVIS